MESIVVTRHEALLQFLQENNIVPAGTPVKVHANEVDVRGKHVYGVLPMRLAAEAAMLTEVSMVIPPEYRGRELSLENIKAFAPTLTTYKVVKV